MGEQSVLAIVPARGGSKGLPGKNIRPLLGTPLLGWTIQASTKAGCVDSLVVSTDDAEIRRIAEDFGASVIHRPAELSQDHSLVMDAVRNVLSQLEEMPDIVVLLQPTSPLRSPKDIKTCVSRLISDSTMDSVATYVEADLNPWRAWEIQDGIPTQFIKEANPWLPRQLLPPAYQLNGAVYAFRPARLPENGTSFIFGSAGAVIMPKERSLDIDTDFDWIIAEHLLSRTVK